MDGLTALLDGPRARGAFVLRCLLDQPWAIRLEDGAPLSVTAVVRGQAWVHADGADPVRLDPGDVVVRCDPEPWSMAEPADAPTLAVIEPGQRCVTPDGRSLDLPLRQGIRSWGTGPTARTELLTGVYEVEGAVGGRLLQSLPPTMVVRRGELDTPVVELLAREAAREAPGQEAVLDRMLDLLTITTVRAWFARPDVVAPGWFRAAADPVVGRALELVHHQPEQPWTVESLAREVGLSRAAFARRFTEQVGEPPMAFLTRWRIDLAADLLLDPSMTVGAAARQVGYATPFALSAAFKRERGISPRDHRRQSLPTVVAG
ncbi:AraC family transcriptional regulator [Knoellia koreensis]|uniref:AraC family transcriptional regulator n=1 Tax=Knoellia koreensis TaxID=2730921 RepID=A0A849HJL1_9MICO|nr:AraC family transcriptional regulator [Knoellia sp. DB2414S]NNM47472.1 AraC family transcriptional regulator [Knoellia sp. DB2414S]